MGIIWNHWSKSTQEKSIEISHKIPSDKVKKNATPGQPKDVPSNTGNLRGTQKATLYPRLILRLENRRLKEKPLYLNRYLK